MASTTVAEASAQVLYDRPDIHKSCKSLETLLSVLNDYCEAAGAVVSLQKKLAKALRDTASSKAINDVAGALRPSINSVGVTLQPSKRAQRQCDYLRSPV